MAANQQLAVPVWDAHADSYLGMLTVTDLVEIVLACRNSKTYSSCLEGLKVSANLSIDPCTIFALYSSDDLNCRQAMTLEHWMCHNARPHGYLLSSVQ